MAIRGRHRADEPLALALAGGATVAEAAASVGISERTAFRRLEDPGFRRLVNQTRGRIFSRAVGKLCRLANEAADLMESALAEVKSGTDVKAKWEAAASVWEHTLKAFPINNVLDRLEALERAGEGEGEDDDDGDAGEHDEAPGLPGDGPPPDEGEGVDSGADDVAPAEGGPGPDAEPLPVHPRRLAGGPTPLFGGA